MSDATIVPQKGVTLEDVWALFQETGKKFQESSAEFDRRLQESREEFRQSLKESREEFDQRLQESREEFRQSLKESREEFRQSLKESSTETERLLKESVKESLKESGAEFDRRMKKNEKDYNKKYGDLTHRFGELAEHLVMPNIVEKFNALGYHFAEVSAERKIFREDGTIGAEFDSLLENGESIVGVEVKTKPVDGDIEDHIERLEFLRKHRSKSGDTREIRGAIAGAIMPENIRLATLRAGLYVIEQSGDTVRIEAPKKLRAW